MHEREDRMTRSTCEQLLEEYRRPGTRTYRETADLLRACGFQERETLRGHAIWSHRRGVLLTVPITRELKVAYKKLVERSILQLRFLDET